MHETWAVGEVECRDSARRVNDWVAVNVLYRTMCYRAVKTNRGGIKSELAVTTLLQ